MAIAFFVDPEYGPLSPRISTPPHPEPELSRSRPRESRARRQLNVQIDENNNHAIPDLSQGVANFPMAQIAEISINVSLESRLSSGRIRNNSETPRRCRRPAGRQHPIPLVNSDQPPPPIDPPEEHDWSLALKVNVNTMAQVGAELRQIGDQFSLEFESSLEHQRSVRGESFRLRCFLKLRNLPSLALAIGFVSGITYLRRFL